MATTISQIELEVSDVSGQKVFKVANVPVANTVGELIQEVLGKMNLPRNDTSGAPLSYQARSERAGRTLGAAEQIGAALETQDRLTLLPNIDAGLQ